MDFWIYDMTSSLSRRIIYQRSTKDLRRIYRISKYLPKIYQTQDLGFVSIIGISEQVLVAINIVFLLGFVFLATPMEKLREDFFHLNALIVQVCVVRVGHAPQIGHQSALQHLDFTTLGSTSAFQQSCCTAELLASRNCFSAEFPFSKRAFQQTCVSANLRFSEVFHISLGALTSVQ